MSINREHFCLTEECWIKCSGLNVTTCLWPPCERCGGPRHPRHPWSACQAVPWPCLEKNMRKIPPKYEKKTYQQKDAVFKITKHTNWKTPHFATLHNFIQFLPRIEWTWQIFMIRCCCACALLWSQNVHLRLLSPKVVSTAFLAARQAMTSRSRSAFCIILFLCFVRTFIFHYFSLCFLAKAQN